MIVSRSLLFHVIASVAGMFGAGVADAHGDNGVAAARLALEQRVDRAAVVLDRLKDRSARDETRLAQWPNYWPNWHSAWPNWRNY